MRIGEYEIGEKLGEGGMGEVYAATHVRLGSRHALKLFTRPAAGADDLRARFEQEGRLLARLRHPRVVRVTDFGADAADGRPYIVLDLVTAPDGAVSFRFYSKCWGGKPAPAFFVKKKSIEDKLPVE